MTEPNGLLAVGGDLSPATVLCAYAQGIFPWFGDDEEILWWTPSPRMVLRPSEIHISRSMRKHLRQSDWEIRYDSAFDDVIKHCASVARGTEAAGTWITSDMQVAYQALHDMGVAHSVEVFENDRLIGGLYGVLLGQMFFGESMFSLCSNASKTAFIALGKACAQAGIDLIDCQIANSHLASLGATDMSREDFENHLRDAIKVDMGDIFTNPLGLVPERRQRLDERLLNLVPRSAEELL